MPDKSEEEHQNEQKRPEWLDDPRIAFSQATGKWIFEDDDGQEFEYDSEASKWVKVSEEKLLEEIGLTAEQRTAQDTKPKRRRNQDEGIEKEEIEAAKATSKRLKSESEVNSQQAPPKGIYISGLAKETTKEMLDRVFSRYGMISEDIATGEKRIKLYTDKGTGEPKGDALIVYFRPESVPMAIEMMDGYELEPGTGPKISVQVAEFKPKDLKEESDKASSDKALPKKAVQRKYKKLQERVYDWDSDEEDNGATGSERSVILKHTFDLDEVKDVSVALDIKQDLYEGCSEIGPVSSVKIYDLEEEGIAQIKFDSPIDAAKCASTMNGRFFGGRKLQAELYDGITKYKKQRDDNDEEQESQRLEQFAEWLEKDGKDQN